MSLLIALLAFLFVGLKALECLSGVLAAFAGDVAVFDGAINRELAFVQCSSLEPVFSVMERKYVRLIPPGDVFDLLHFELVDFFFVLKKKKKNDNYQLSIIDYNLRKHSADPDTSNFTVSSPGISTIPRRI